MILFTEAKPPELSPLIQIVLQVNVTETTETPKIVTWQDNPNQCDQTTQYIALESPYYCIPKPTPKPTQRRSDSTFQASSTRTPVSAKGSSTGNLYQSGQCVWYIKNMRPELPNTWRSAKNWLANARADGWPTGSTPQVNAVGVRGNHVVLITAVNSDGTVSYTDMNGNYIPYEIGYGTKPANYYQYIY